MDVIDWNHPCTKNTVQMSTAWLMTVKNDVLCKLFQEYMKIGWNNGLLNLMKHTSESEDGVGGGLALNSVTRDQQRWKTRRKFYLVLR